MVGTFHQWGHCIIIDLYLGNLGFPKSKTCRGGIIINWHVFNIKIENDRCSISSDTSIFVYAMFWENNGTFLSSCMTWKPKNGTTCWGVLGVLVDGTLWRSYCQKTSSNFEFASRGNVRLGHPSQESTIEALRYQVCCSLHIEEWKEVI